MSKVSNLHPFIIIKVRPPLCATQAGGEGVTGAVLGPVGVIHNPVDSVRIQLRK